MRSLHANTGSTTRRVVGTLVVVSAMLLTVLQPTAAETTADPLDTTAETGVVTIGDPASGMLPTGTVSELLTINDLNYLGAFRLPFGTFGASRTGYSEGVIGLGETGDSLFVSGHAHDVAIGEFPLADPSPAGALDELPIAGNPTQPFSLVVERAPTGNPQALDRLSGMYVVDGALLVNGYEYYDAATDNTHTTLSVDDAGALADSPVSGWAEMAGAVHSAGWMSAVSAEWQNVLGASHISGHASGMPIVSRASFGPSAFAVNLSADMAGIGAATPLVDFSLDEPLNPDFSNDTGTNDLWTHLSRAVYGVIVPGTSTYLTIGYSGGHASGVSYGDPPYGGYKGYYPNQVDDVSPYYWLWDVNDLAAVRAGDVAPGDVRPYAHGPWDLPFIQMAGNRLDKVGGATFDPASGRLYVSLSGVDYSQNEWEPNPLILVFELGEPSEPPTDPEPEPPTDPEPEPPTDPEPEPPTDPEPEPPTDGGGDDPKPCNRGQAKRGRC